jgi:hypothetical protein
MVARLRKRLAGPLLAFALLLGAAVFPSAAMAQRMAEGFDMQCVYYTETSGACVSTTHWSDGTVEHRWYVFWGNWYAEV